MIIGEYTRFTFILLFTICLLYFKWKLSRWHLYNCAKKIPLSKSLPNLPIFGVGLSLMGNTEHKLKVIRKLFSKTSPPQSIWLGPKLYILINRVEDMEVVLNSPKCLAKDDLYDIIGSLLGDGILTSAVPKWKKHRKIIMPTFHRRILEQFVDVFSQQSSIFIKQLENKCGQVTNVLENINKYSLDAICETTMGVSINAQTTDCSIYHVTKRAMEILMVRICNVIYHFDWIYNLTEQCKEVRHCADVFSNFVLDVIQKKVSEYKQKIAEEKETVEMQEVKKRPVFLEQLIRISENVENWTTEELRAEVATIMLAGSDTSATVASFTLILLAMHPEIQQKCYEEVIEVLGPDRQPEHTDLPQLMYLEKVIKESMRLFPIAPIVLRKIEEDVDVGGYTLPKGAGLIIGITGIHSSDQYYKDPWKFDPERFSPEEVSKRHRYAYLPFSAGPRNCVGITYAMMSLKTLIAVTLRKYRIETIYNDIREIRLKQALMIESVDGCPLRLFLRN